MQFFFIFKYLPTTKKDKVFTIVFKKIKILMNG